MRVCMKMAAHTHLYLVVLGTAVSLSMTFNIDIMGPKIYNGSREDFFGFKALQFQSGRQKGVFVSAPLQNNGTGGVFICDDTTPNCRPLPLPSPGEATRQNSFKEVGITLAVTTTPSLQFTACSPGWSQECDGSPYLNSICYQWSSRDSSISSITSAHKGCSKQKVDVVFLLDGSRSVMDGDFKKSKEFVKAFMHKMHNTSVQFAAVQFSMGFRTVFTFKDFQDKKALRKLDKEKQIKSLTNTHKAMRFTLENLFDNPESGRHPAATQAVVIITNGNPSDIASMASVKVNGGSKTILEVYEALHIFRFVIGVGRGVNMAKLRKLASEPKLNNSLYIHNFAGLNGLLKNLQTKIFNIEGFKHNMAPTWEKDPTSQTGMSAEFIKACSPAWKYECDGPPYFNTICYQWNSKGLKECTKQKVDVVFLFGGSRSMTDGDFIKTKELIKAFMNKMQNTSIQFAAVQFSTGFQTVFTFKDFQDEKALVKLENERRMKSLTSTHIAMRSTLVNLFDNPENGGHPDATKAVVIIDGNPKDTASTTSLKVGKEKQGMTKLSLASAPTWNNTLQNYAGFNGLMTNLEKMINKKGSKHNSDETWEEALSQTGMHAQFAEDILGAVSNNWKGSLYQVEAKNSPELEILNPYRIHKNDSYMGYPVAIGKKNAIRLYFIGAPKYNNKGQVMLCTKNLNQWTVLQRVDSEKIGSYFGSELCAVDVDSDGTTDFLMVGAPFSSEPQREGCMHVYMLTGENKLVKIQNVSVASLGRFASSMASLRDLNGDGLQDLAVGAPLEDDQRGAIYIYLGDKTLGIQPKYSQHIRAEMLSVGLQQFGVTIDGKSDMDGLTEIAVGARGHVVLLRSRPVFSVSAHFSFSPSEVTVQHTDCCSKQTEAFPVFHVTLCFKMREDTKSTKDVLSTGLKVDYDLTVDSQRQNSLGFLAAENSRSIQTRLHLNKTETCQKHTIYLQCQSCGVDTGSPVQIKVNFSQAENQQPYGILNDDSKREAIVEVPFEYYRPGP